MQHIERVSRGTCVTYHVLRKDSSAIKFNRVEIAFILSFIIFLAEPLTDEGGLAVQVSRDDVVSETPSSYSAVRVSLLLNSAL